LIGKGLGSTIVHSLEKREKFRVKFLLKAGRNGRWEGVGGKKKGTIKRERNVRAVAANGRKKLGRDRTELFWKKKKGLASMLRESKPGHERPGQVTNLGRGVHWRVWLCWKMAGGGGGGLCELGT